MRQPLTEPVVDGKAFLLVFLILLVAWVWWLLRRLQPPPDPAHEIYEDPEIGWYCGRCGMVGTKHLRQTTCKERSEFF